MTFDEQIEALGKEGEGIVIISKNTLRDLMSKMRKDIHKKICTTREAMEILSLSKDRFYSLTFDKDSLIRPSKLKGKWVLQSIYDEANRLNEE